jgi:hypothetical protein
MQTRRLKSALLAGSLSTMAAAIAATTAAPMPVAAAENSVRVAQAMSHPCGPTKPCAPAKHNSMHRTKTMTSGRNNPCGPGRGSPNASPYGANPCGSAANNGRGG